MFTISVCMIVKNESGTLSQILSCAEKFADEIIVVDTGSSDNTVEIAKKFGCKIFSYPWDNNFSNARNFSFSKATRDYQMWLDADDFIDEKNIQKILNLKKLSSQNDAFMMKYLTGFDENDTPTLVYWRERLLKRESNFLWQGFVHEVIAPCGQIQYTDIEIEHRKRKVTNPKRNLMLYQIARKENHIFSAREQYYYSKELFYNNEIYSAIKNLKKFLKMENCYAPDSLDAHKTLCKCYIIQNDIDKAENILLSCIKKHSPTREIMCLFGQINDMKKQFEKAILCYNLVFSLPKDTFGFVSTIHNEVVPHIELSKLYYQTGQHEKAKEHHIKAKKLAPKHPAVLFNDKFF